LSPSRFGVAPTEGRAREEAAGCVSAQGERRQRHLRVARSWRNQHPSWEGLEGGGGGELVRTWPGGDAWVRIPWDKRFHLGLQRPRGSFVSSGRSTKPCTGYSWHVSRIGAFRTTSARGRGHRTRHRCSACRRLRYRKPTRIVRACAHDGGAAPASPCFCSC
jgi:hypothetical protein